MEMRKGAYQVKFLLSLQLAEDYFSVGDFFLFGLG
jgi:hypothetical protein